MVLTRDCQSSTACSCRMPKSLNTVDVRNDSFTRSLNGRTLDGIQIMLPTMASSPSAACPLTNSERRLSLMPCEVVEAAHVEDVIGYPNCCGADGSQDHRNDDAQCAPCSRTQARCN